MVTVTEITKQEDIDMDERLMECHDGVTGGHIIIRFYRWGPRGEIMARAHEIATGHFAAKARAEAKAL